MSPILSTICGETCKFLRNRMTWQILMAWPNPDTFVSKFLSPEFQHLFFLSASNILWLLHQSELSICLKHYFVEILFFDTHKWMYLACDPLSGTFPWTVSIVSPSVETSSVGELVCSPVFDLEPISPVLDNVVVGPLSAYTVTLFNILSVGQEQSWIFWPTPASGRYGSFKKGYKRRKPKLTVCRDAFCLHDFMPLHASVLVAWWRGQTSGGYG